MISLQEYKDFGFNYEFEDVSHIKKSHVWKFFLFNKPQSLSKCRFCNKFISVVNGNTTTMSRHLKAKHQSVLDVDNADNNLAAASIVNTENK